MSSELPTGSLSNVPWRRAGVKYANNEVSVNFMRVKESLNTNVYKCDY